MRFYLLLFIFITSSGVLLSQDSIQHEQGSQKKWLYRKYTTGVMEESSLGIVPEITALQHFGYGVALSKGNFAAFGMGGTGRGINLGYSFEPSLHIQAIHTSAWFNFNILGLGFYAAAKGLCYIVNRQPYYALRPEIGYGIMKLNIFYGYNFFLSDHPENISRYTLGISYYQRISPLKEIYGSLPGAYW